MVHLPSRHSNKVKPDSDLFDLRGYFLKITVYCYLPESIQEQISVLIFGLGPEEPICRRGYFKEKKRELARLPNATLPPVAVDPCILRSQANLRSPRKS